MRRYSTLATALAVTFLISACGGSGGGSSGPILNEGPLDDETDVTGGESSGEGGENSGDGGLAGNPNEGSEGGDLGNPITEVPVEMQPSDGDAVVALGGGREARVLATSNGPVIGVPGATMRQIDERAIHPAGFIVYSGTYTTGASSFPQTEGLWAGPAREPGLLLGGNAEISGLPVTVRFAGTESVSVASDGSVAAHVSLGGSRETSALIVASNSAPVLLAESGTPISGLSAEKSITSFNGISRAAGWTAFEAQTSDRGRGLWLAGAEGITAIAEHSDSNVNNAPRLGDCRVFVEQFSSRNDRPRALDDGTVVFHATLGTYTRDQRCANGLAVVRYKEGAYSKVVAPGDIVPGTTTSTFSDIRLLGVTASDAVVVGATLSTPIGGSRPDTRWSFWLYPSEGAPRLIALQGEEVQLNGATETFSGRERSLDVNAAGQIAFRTTFDDQNRSAALFGGTANTGQPHAAVSAPGASSLTFLLDSTVTVPPPFVASTFFSIIGRPSVDASGQVVFFGRVTDSELARTVVDALWRSDLEGNLVPLIDGDDTAPVAGVPQSLTSLLQLDRTSYRFNELLINPLDNGGFVLGDNLGFGNDTLVFLGPEQGL